MVVRTSLAVETGINKVISPAFVVFVEHGINNLHAPFSACSTSERVFQQPHLILSKGEGVLPPRARSTVFAGGYDFRNAARRGLETIRRPSCKLCVSSISIGVIAIERDASGGRSEV